MLEYEVRAMLAMRRAKDAVVKRVHDFFVDENGDTNLISIVIVLVIVLGLAVVFRKNIAELVNSMWTSIFEDAKTATGAGGSSTKFDGSK